MKYVVSVLFSNDYMSNRIFKLSFCFMYDLHSASTSLEYTKSHTFT